MTLVVSEISRYGIIMTGDSAVTRRSSLGHTTVVSDAVKVQFSDAANIGFSIWGHGDVGTVRLDYWLRDFIASEIHSGDSVEDVGQRLTSTLNTAISAAGGVPPSHVRGIHIAGFRDNNPVLFHIHGSLPLVFHHDYPDDVPNVTRDQFYRGLTFAHLRNGLHQHFGMLFDTASAFAQGLKATMNIDFPPPDLRGRLEFYKLLVKFVADVLLATRQHPGVNGQLSSIAFDCTGLQYDERLLLGTSSSTPPGTTFEF